MCQKPEKALDDHKPVRFTQLDVIRATAVFAVAICHIYPISDDNPLLTLHWVMQYICMISGVTMALSKNPIGSSWRLLIVFAAGCALNATPLLLRYAIGKKRFFDQFEEEDHEFANNVVAVIYQFWYVLLLLLTLGLIAPLKFALKSLRGAIVYGSVALTCTVAFGIWAIVVSVKNSSMKSKFISETAAAKGNFGADAIPLYVTHLCGAFVMVCIAEAFRSWQGVKCNSESYVGWALMVYIVGLVVCTETLFVYDFFVYPQLMLLGFTLYRNPLRFRESLQSFLEVGWPVVIFFCYLLSMNLENIRPHIVPDTGLFDRSRYSLINFLFMALFAVCFAPCAGEKRDLAPSWRMGTEDTSWIAMWSLFVYGSHWALCDFVNMAYPLPEGFEKADKRRLCYLPQKKFPAGLYNNKEDMVYPLPEGEVQTCRRLYLQQTFTAILLLAMAIPFFLFWNRTTPRCEGAAPSVEIKVICEGGEGEGDGGEGEEGEGAGEGGSLDEETSEVPNKSMKAGVDI